MAGKYINILLAGLLTILLSACSDDRDSLSGQASGDPLLTFNMTRAGGDIVGNTLVYLFDGQGSDAGKFNHKVQEVTYGPDQLSMTVAAGTWNIALVTANTDFSSGLIQPVRSVAREDSKMWETQPVGGTLPSMPELRTASIDGQLVVGGQDNSVAGTTILSRNVALVKVVIADAGGLDVNGTHNFELKDVPTTLNWEGGLFPTAKNPRVSTVPMTGIFRVKDSTSLPGHQRSDTLYFIIPAHKGNDYLNANPKDTTESHMKVSVDLACEGGSRFQKTDVVIPRVPRVNGILLVRLLVGGKLDVTADVLGWEDVELNTDLSQTQLYTDKASVGLSHKDTLYVNTNASDFSVQSPGGWITSVRKIANNGVEITANVDTYVDNQPRSSYITIKANNVTKRIPVTQRPDEGTISVNNKRLVFCPNLHENRQIEITSIGGDWKFLTTNPRKATANKQNGVAGNSTVSFTRSSVAYNKTLDEGHLVYGDTTVIVKNMMTLDTDTIRLTNCYIYVDDNNTIAAKAPEGGASSAETISEDVIVYGGDRIIENFSSPQNWIRNISWDFIGQKLTFTTDRNVGNPDPEDDDEPRSGKMTFRHATCPDYVVTANVYQDILVTIPPFHFFVVKFTWKNNDVDIAVEFAGNHLTSIGANNSTYDKIPVGYSMHNHNKGKAPEVIGTAGGTSTGRVSFEYRGQTLLQWGGDATGGQGETVFFNAPVLEGDVNSPRKIKLDVYATWYTSDRAPDTMTLTMYAYKGGSMQPSGTNFVHVGGETEPLYDKAHIVMITTTKGASNYSATTGGYTKVATITYDRVKHSASIKVWAAVP